jgi:hypothetical protein
MTKMQIIAKAVLSALGIHIALVLSANIENLLGIAFYRAADNPPILLSLACLTAYALLIAAVSFWLVFNNNQLACRLAGHAQTLSHPEQHRTLITSYRLALLLVGLFFLPEAIKTIVRFLSALWPPDLREAFTWLINTGTLPRNVNRPSSQWYALIAKNLTAALACYLILGAPHFVRWQLNHSITESTPSSPEGSNEP